MTEKKTNYTFKLLYAMAIFFIVGGHCGHAGIDLFYNWFSPFGFMVALFIFCSGYFYNAENENQIGKYTLKKIKRLLIPLYLWNLFYGILASLLHLAGFSIGKALSFDSLLLAPIYSGHQFEYNLAGWFVFPLFMVEIVAVVLRKLFSYMKLKNEYVIFVLFLGVGIAGTCLSVKGYHTGWWLVLARFFYFLPFYGLGRLYKEKIEKIDKLNSLVYFAIVFAVSLITIYLHKGVVGYSISECNNFGNCIGPFVVGTMGIAFWLRVAKLLEPVAGRNKYVLKVADNTFSIMMHHLLGIFVMNSGFALLNKLGVGCSSFDWNAYRTDIWYRYVPLQMFQFNLVYVVFAIIFSICLGTFVKRILKYGSRKK